MDTRCFDACRGGVTRPVDDELPLLTDLLVATAERVLGAAAEAEYLERYVYDPAPRSEKSGDETQRETLVRLPATDQPPGERRRPDR